MDKQHTIPAVFSTVAVIMGSDSDWPVMKEACDILGEFEVPHVKRVLSAHRTPEDVIQFVKESESSGTKVIIAGAGGAAHLPGVVAALTVMPVIGVPMFTKSLGGVDSLYSIVQMPKGIPVATVAIEGGTNAGLLALQILGIYIPEISRKLEKYREKLAEESRGKSKNLS